MERIEQKLRLLQPVIPERQWAFLKSQYVLAKDYRQRQKAELLIDLILSQKIPGLPSETILLPPPAGEELSGDYPIGTVIYPEDTFAQFGIRTNEWLRHCGIFGKTGSGKTTLAIQIIRQLCQKDQPFLIFDYKRNFRDLLGHPDFKNEDILIFTVGRNDAVPFYFNPKIRPDGVEEYVWIKQLAQIIEKVYLLGPGANDVFMESAGQPTFQAMQNKVLSQKKRARELLWWASVKRTLNAINYPGLGEMVNCLKGIPIQKLLKRKVILELDGLSRSDQAFVIGSLLLWIYHFRMRQPERELLKHFIIIEEAHHLFLKSGHEEDIADIIMREIRELGESIIIIDQHPHKLSHSALGNLSTKIALSMSLNQDVMALSNAMLLTREQQPYLSKLTVGKGICRSDRFIQPVLLKIPNFPINKGLISDHDLKQHMQRYLDDLGVVPAVGVKTSDVCSIQKDETLSPLAEILLENIALHPFLGVVKRFKKLGLKVSYGYKLLEELAGLKLIIPLTIDGNRLYDLTTKSKQMLGKKVHHRGRGGIEHRYHLYKITEYFKSIGAKVYLEKDDIDLIAKVSGVTIAIQLETGKSNLQGNLYKLGRLKADKKYMVSTNHESEVVIKDLFKDLIIPDKENIQIFFIKDLLAHLHKTSPISR